MRWWESAKRKNLRRSLNYRCPHRHPWDRGGHMQIAATNFFRDMMTNSFWKKHQEPFSKSERGRKRRQEKLFRQQERERCLK